MNCELLPAAVDFLLKLTCRLCDRDRWTALSPPMQAMAFDFYDVDANMKPSEVRSIICVPPSPNYHHAVFASPGHCHAVFNALCLSSSVNALVWGAAWE